jgi:hypothetical protein
MERGILEFLEQRLGPSRRFEAILDGMVPGSTEALAASVAEHWPAESVRPDVVDRVLARFGG